MGETRGGYRPAWLAAARIARAQARARTEDQVFSHAGQTITRGELLQKIRERVKTLPEGPVFVHDDNPETVLVDALAGMCARRSVRVIPANAGEAALRAAHTSTSTGLMFFTTGTTGNPRPAAARPGLRTLAQQIGIIGMLPELIKPTVACLAPIDRGHGFSALAMALLTGGHFLLGDQELRRHEHVDVLTGVPLQLHELAANPPSTTFGLVLSGSDHLRDGARLEQALRAPLHDAYGATETGTLTVATPEDRRRSPGTVGRPLPGVRIREDAGMLVVHAPASPQGEITLDRGHVEDGLVHLAGRVDDVLISGGLNIPVDEIRQFLATRSPGCVLGWAHDARFGQRLTVSCPGDDDALRAALQAEFGLAAPRVVAENDSVPPSQAGRDTIDEA